MTDSTTPAIAGGDAQPIADVNPIDAIIDAAETEPAKDPKAEPVEQEPTDDAVDEPWPKKAENALAKAKGKAAQLKAERDQERAARQRLEQQLSQYKTQQPKAENTGEPQEKDFANYHDYIRAVNKYETEQLLNARDGKQKETQQNEQQQKWVAEREHAVTAKTQEFVKDTPDAVSVIEEHADIADEFSPELQRLFLEADNAPLAFYNLAKEGKLESLTQMSLARAAMEIGRAQTQAPIKPKTKAPTPLPASRGSVPSGKSLDSMSGDELLKWVNS